MNVTFELFDELRKVMEQGGETPQGLTAMALVQLHERLSAIESTLEEMSTFDHRGKAELRCRCENCR